MTRPKYHTRKQLSTERPTWHAFYEDKDGKLKLVRNNDGRPIAYASEQAAMRQAVEHHNRAKGNIQ